MPYHRKLPENVEEVLKDLNILKTKEKLVKKYGCTRNGMESYLQRKGVKLVRESRWVLVQAESK
jgi:hypothetical protein